MKREKEFEKVKKIIKKYYGDACCGIFDTRNIAGDEMENIFEGEYFTVDICYYWNYFEVFGTTEKEFEILEHYYLDLRDK